MLILWQLLHFDMTAFNCENGFVRAGWVARFYVDGSVPSDIITQLKGRGAEIVVNDNIKGGIAGMFWRFLIADDPTVDR